MLNVKLQQAAGGNLSEFKLWTLNRSLLEPFCVERFIKSSQKIKQKVSIEVIVLVQFCNIRHSQYRSLNKLQCSYIQGLALVELWDFIFFMANTNCTHISVKCPHMFKAEVFDKLMRSVDFLILFYKTISNYLNLR